MPLPPDSVGEGIMFVFGLSVRRVRPFIRLSVSPADDLIRFWRSKVKVTAGRQVGEGIHAEALASNSIL